MGVFRYSANYVNLYPDFILIPDCNLTAQSYMYHKIRPNLTREKFKPYASSTVYCNSNHLRGDG
jgi:hypothetical protein